MEAEQVIQCGYMWTGCPMWLYVDRLSSVAICEQVVQCSYVWTGERVLINTECQTNERKTGEFAILATQSDLYRQILACKDGWKSGWISRQTSVSLGNPILSRQEI